LTGLNVLTITHRDQRTDRERDVDRVLGTGDLDLFTGVVHQLDLRAHHRLAATRLRRDDDQSGQTRDFVELLADGHTLFDVLDADAALVAVHDGARERIPRGQSLARLHDLAVTHRNGGTVRNLMALALATVVVEDHDFAGA